MAIHVSLPLRRTQCTIEPSWSSVREIWGGGSVAVGSAERTFATAIVAGGRWRRSAKSGFVRCQRGARRQQLDTLRWSIPAWLPSVKRIGWSRSPVDWTSNRNATSTRTPEKRTHFQTDQRKQIVLNRFSSPSRHTQRPAVLFW